MDLVERAEEELKCLYEELPPPGADGRDYYVAEIEKWQKIREDAAKQKEPKKDKLDLVLKIAGVVTSIATGIFIPLSNRKFYLKIMRESWMFEKEGIISSPTTKNFNRQIDKFFKI